MPVCTSQSLDRARRQDEHPCAPSPPGPLFAKKVATSSFFGSDAARMQRRCVQIVRPLRLPAISCRSARARRRSCHSGEDDVGCEIDFAKIGHSRKAPARLVTSFSLSCFSTSVIRLERFPGKHRHRRAKATTMLTRRRRCRTQARYNPDDRKHFEQFGVRSMARLSFALQSWTGARRLDRVGEILEAQPGRLAHGPDEVRGCRPHRAWSPSFIYPSDRPLVGEGCPTGGDRRLASRGQLRSFLAEFEPEPAGVSP
jgi:hypothetical protein